MPERIVDLGVQLEPIFPRQIEISLNLTIRQASSMHVIASETD